MSQLKLKIRKWLYLECTFSVICEICDFIVSVAFQNNFPALRIVGLCFCWLGAQRIYFLKQDRCVCLIRSTRWYEVLERIDP